MSFMTCEETRHTLSLYVDDGVSLPTRVAIDEHLDRCPVCRAEVAELRSLTRSLNMMTRPTPPLGLAETITDLLTIEAAARLTPKPSWGRRVARFLEPRLMPYSVGSFASVILFFLMFTALRPHFVALREAALNNGSFYAVRPVPAMPGYDLHWPVDSESFAASRAPFGEESPSLNPSGALAAFTRLHASRHHDADDDDMIVGAIVFKDGTASLVDVVQAPRNRRMLDELESALRQDPSFVPASFDRRPDTMRFYFALGTKVEVDGQNF
ncbi:MAG TPA: zf-HC2 domain-containing protein [Pyrinomonadaceae bacterium]|nr:zf-HC2 domain-containing protein [Pyrinomonadaceae bacterium]